MPNTSHEQFYALNFELISHPDHHTLYTDSGELEITLGHDPRAALLVHLKYRSGEKIEGGASILPWASENGAGTTIRLSIPRPGYFYVEVFAKPKSQEGDLHLTMRYNIRASKGTTREQPNIWPLMHDLGIGLISHPHSHTIKMENGEVAITLSVPNETATLVDVMPVSKKGKRGHILEGAVSSRVESGEMVVSVSLPRAGKYEITIYGKPKSQEGIYNCVLSYMLETSVGSTKEQPNIWPLMHDLGIKLVSHPYSRTIKAKNGEVAITLSVPDSIATLVDVMPVPKRGTRGHILESAVTKRVVAGEMVASVNLPRPGKYELTVYAKPKSEEGSYKCVLKYMLEAPVGTRKQLPKLKRYQRGGRHQQGRRRPEWRF